MAYHSSITFNTYFFMYHELNKIKKLVQSVTATAKHITNLFATQKFSQNHKMKQGMNLISVIIAKPNTNTKSFKRN